MHDPTKIQFGSFGESSPKIEDFDGDPASLKAGLAVSLGSDGKPALAKSAGFRIGISMGKSFSETKRLSVARKGCDIPGRVALKRSTGTITITDYANLVSGTDDVVTIGGVAFTAQAGAATLGDPTFQAATSNNATATSLAAQINAHATAKTLVYASVTNAIVTLYAVASGAQAGNDVAVSYTDNDTNVGITLAGLTGGKLAGGSNTLSDATHVVIGGKAYINDFTGEFDANISGISTISDATYVSSLKTGIEEDGTTSVNGAAYLELPGGL